ncbi:MAG: Rieske (2Fe-2S) protein [Alcanivorax sp.]|nr:Rieske (2Fe-2S) protein [Alcanivorax sp.]
MPVRIDQQELLLIHEQGQSWLMSRRCPHADFPLDQATVHGNLLRCPGHGLEFSLRTGQCTANRYCLRQYRLDYEGQWLGVDL